MSVSSSLFKTFVFQFYGCQLKEQWRWLLRFFRGDRMTLSHILRDSVASFMATDMRQPAGNTACHSASFQDIYVSSQPTSQYVVGKE